MHKMFVFVIFKFAYKIAETNFIFWGDSSVITKDEGIGFLLRSLHLHGIS
jgi:hypothetical protein